jgi:ankyrin repeat protein
VIAAKNGQQNVVEFLIEKLKAEVNPCALFSDSALKEAVFYNHDKLVDYLLKQGADVNYQDRYKLTPLMHAVICNNLSMVKKLLKHKQEIDFSKRTINNRTLLHYVAAENNPEMASYLLAVPEVKLLLTNKDMFGFTPLDLAIQYGIDSIILLLEPACDLEAIKQSAHYGQKPVRIDHGTLIPPMFFYLQSHYRSTEFLSTEGVCNGLSYLKSLYFSRYIFGTLRLMASWDGISHTLKQPLNADIPQSKFYKKKRNLFEQWIGNIIWFQHSTLSEVDFISVDDRVQQSNMIGVEDDYQHQSLFSTPSIARLSMDQTLELASYWAKMPVGAKIEIKVDNHVSSAEKTSQGISHYDSNIALETVPCQSDVFLQRIIDWQYILVKKYEQVHQCSIRFFNFKQDERDLNLDQFEVFRDDELPKSKIEARNFQSSSANKLTHLHVAVMTHSLPVINKLIESDLCDVNAKNAFNQTALQIAIIYDYIPAMKAILKSPNIDINSVLATAYNCDQHELVEMIMKNSKPKPLNDLLIAAITKDDLPLIVQLIENKLVDVNSFEENNNLPVDTAILLERTAIIKYLFNYVSDAAKLQAFEKSLFMKPSLSLFIISLLNDVNAVNNRGNTAIHCAALFLKADAIEALIRRGADITMKGKSLGLPLEHASSTFMGKEGDRAKCIDLLIPTDEQQLLMVLLEGINKLSDLLYKKVLEKCSTKIINTLIENEPYQGFTILHVATLSRQISKFKLLVEAGCDIDAIMPKSGDTALMVLIKDKKYPERYQLISLLLANKADTTITNQEGKTAVDLVDDSEDEELKSMFSDCKLILK